MIFYLKRLLAIFVVVSLTACASTGPRTYDFKEDRSSVKVLLMPTDVEMRFVKVGSNEVRADWTETANANFKGSITEHLKSTGEDVVHYEDYTAALGDMEQLILLQQQVANAMSSHVVVINPATFKGQLPHKKGEQQLTYSLGNDAKALKAATGADYAAFLTARYAIESGGSFWTKVAIGAVTGYTPALADFRGTYVSLVDLETGDVKWLNAHAGSMFGSDARQRAGTDGVINKIMEKGPFIDAAAE